MSGRGCDVDKIGEVELLAGSGEEGKIVGGVGGWSGEEGGGEIFVGAGGMLGGWSGGGFEGVDAAAARGLVMNGWRAGGRVGEIEEEVCTCFFGLVATGSGIDWGWGAGWRGGYHVWGGLLAAEGMDGEVVLVLVSGSLNIEF